MEQLAGELEAMQAFQGDILGRVEKFDRPGGEDRRGVLVAGGAVRTDQASAAHRKTLPSQGRGLGGTDPTSGEFRSVTDIIVKSDEKEGEDGEVGLTLIKVVEGPEGQAEDPLVTFPLMDSDEEEFANNRGRRIDREFAAEMNEAGVKIGLLEEGEVSIGLFPQDNVEKTKQFQLVDETPFAFFGVFGNSATSAILQIEQGDNQVGLTMVMEVEHNGVGLAQHGHG